MSVGLVEVGFISLSLVQSDYAGISPARQNIIIFFLCSSSARIKLEQIVIENNEKIVINKVLFLSLSLSYLYNSYNYALYGGEILSVSVNPL